MLHSLKTKNFKKLNDHEFDFTDGLNIICGDNWAGKTTLTKAIAFALFGVRAVGKAENIPTWGSSDVEVVLEVYDYTITRTLKNCTVVKAGVQVAVGNSACSAYIQDNITGVDYKGFKLFNWSGQDETAALLTIGATQLQRDIEKFSGVQFIDDIVKAASKDMNLLEGELHGAELIDLEGKDAEAEELRSKLSLLVDKSASTKETLDEAKTRLAGVRHTLEESEKTERRRSLLTNKLAEITASADEIANSIAAAKAELDGIVSKEWSGEAVLAEARASLKKGREVNAKVATAEKDKDRLTCELAELRKEEVKDVERGEILQTLNEAADTAKEEATKAKESLSAAGSKVAELEESIASGVCSKCKRPFEGYDEAEAAQELAEAQSSIKILRDVFSEALAAKSAAISALDSAERPKGAAARIPEVNAAIMEAAQTLIDLNPVNLDDLETAISDLVAEKALAEAAEAQRYKAESALRSAEKRATVKAQEAAEVNESIAALPDSVDIADLYVEEGGLEADIRAFELEGKDLTHEAQTAGDALARLTKYITDSKEYNRQVESLTKEAELLKTFIKFLRDSRVTFLASVWDQILGMASSFVSEATEGAITAIVKRDEFEFCEDGVYVPVTEASGAQRGFIGVAMRVALSESLRVGLPTIVFDEPSAAMRETQAAQLAGGLLGQEQVLMITHRESDQVSGSSIIEV